MNRMQLLVKEFHDAFGVPAAERPRFIEKARRDLRIRLIKEELMVELEEAMDSGNLVAVADALGDSLVVVFGAAVEFGLDMEPIVNEIHRSNMSKLGADGKPIHRDDGKILKGPHFSPPDLEPIIDIMSRQELLPFPDGMTNQKHLTIVGCNYMIGAALEVLGRYYKGNLELVDTFAPRKIRHVGVDFDLNDKSIDLAEDAARGNKQAASLLARGYLEPAMAQMAQLMGSADYCIRINPPHAVDLSAKKIDWMRGFCLRFMRQYFPGAAGPYPEPPRWINRFDIAVASQ
jgi:predicted HAD superfamily Cof-like phosphohydrolase